MIDIRKYVLDAEVDMRNFQALTRLDVHGVRLSVADCTISTTQVVLMTP